MNPTFSLSSAVAAPAANVIASASATIPMSFFMMPPFTSASVCSVQRFIPPTFIVTRRRPAVPLYLSGAKGCPIIAGVFTLIKDLFPEMMTSTTIVTR